MTGFIRESPKFAALLAALMAASLMISAWSFYSTKRNLCHGRGQSLVVMRAILVDARAQALAARQSPEQRQAVASFYARQFARIDQATC